MIYKLFKKPFFARFQKPWHWPADYQHSATWEPTEFMSKSHGDIKGLLGAALTDKVKGNIVCAHPMGYSARGYFLKNGIADFLRNSGYNVLIFDFNGFGDSSDGDYNLPEDVIAAGNKLQEWAPGHKLGIFGISFGGAMSVCALSKKENPYTSAVFESTFSSLAEFWAHFGMLGKLIKIMQILTPGVEKKMNAMHNVSKIKNTKKILWIHGDADIQTPVEMGLRLQKAANIPSDLWVVPEGEHARCYTKNPELYNDKLVDFFGETL